MFYPSHFGTTYLSGYTEKPQSYNVYEYGVKMANKYKYEGTSIRPYLQAFPYRAKPKFDSFYIKHQIDGTVDGASDGYGFWSPTSKYEKLEYFLNLIK